MIYAADFETTTNPNDCRVWAWALSPIDDPENVSLGTDLDSYMYFMQENGGTYYFHNLKFDGNFILHWLFRHNYRFSKKTKRQLEPGEFTTLISDMGTWYTVNINMYPTPNGISNRVEIRDSAKIIPLPVSEIPKAYGLKENKLEIDYNEDRPIGHQLTPEEIAYVSADVVIVAKAVKFMRENKQTKLTSASNALFDFKQRYDKTVYGTLFPALNAINDKDIRQSYKGGWTYLNPKYKNREIESGMVLDVNSMYPWAMKYCLLPYGHPVYFSGPYKPNPSYPLYVINLTVEEFHLKPGKYPSIQLKHNTWYAPNEYIEHSVVPTTMTLTSVDYELFLENYDITGQVEFHGGYMFMARHGMFTEYVDYWYGQKTEAKKTKNKGMEKIAKLMLNSLYGKFGSRIDGVSKIPWFDAEHNIVRYKAGEKEDRKGGYLPIATFITSYCRDKIIRGANVCGDRFIYGDTDSLHVIGTDPIPGLDVDDFRLGAFKVEELFIRARFIRQKTYLEIYLKNGKETMNLKCAGMPQKLKDTVKEEDFVEGAVFDHSKESRFAPKLTPQVVPGGVILKETTFQIKGAPTPDTLKIKLDDKDTINSTIAI